MPPTKLTIRTLLLSSLFVVSLGCNSQKNSGSTQGIEAAFSAKAVWDSECIDSDRFGLTMRSMIEVNDDTFTRTNQYFSDGNCKDQSISSVETGTLAKKLVDSTSGSLDFRYQTVRVSLLNQSGALAMNTVNYCGSNNWSVGQTRNLTDSSGGEACWEKTPRTVHDVFKVDSSRIYFGVGTEKEKSDPAMWPTALDDSHGWLIR